MKYKMGGVENLIKLLQLQHRDQVIGSRLIFQKTVLE